MCFDWVLRGLAKDGIHLHAAKCKNRSDSACAATFYQGSESCCEKWMILFRRCFQHLADPGSGEAYSPFHSLPSQNFYNQCFQDDTLVMIKDSTPVDRKQLDPNKVGPAIVLPHRGTEGPFAQRRVSVQAHKCLCGSALRTQNLFFFFFFLKWHFSKNPSVGQISNTQCP